MKSILSTICLLAVLLPRFCQAEIVGPYTADANTLYLFHLDQAAGGSVTTNEGSKGLRAYTVNLATASTTPPVVTTVLGATSFTGFGNAANFTTTGYLLGYDQNNSGAYQGEVNAATQSADRFAFTNLNMGNGGQTPFTLEALISTPNTNLSKQIIFGDSTQASVVNRGFQFRIANGGLLFNGIGGEANNTTVTAPIPSTGPHAFVADQWFHVAAVYDGTNMSLYWTALTNTSTSANLITNAPITIGTVFGSKSAPLNIGNENRGSAAELFNGLIDEVRISKVARAANEFVFLDPLSIVSHPQNTTNSPGSTATFTVVAITGYAPLSYQWHSNGVPMVNGGDISGVTSNVLTIANVSAAYAGINYSCSITNSRTPVPDGTNSANATLTIQLPSSLVWNNNSANLQWDTSSQNWSNSVTTTTPVAYTDLDNVRFDNTDPSAGGTITLSGTVSPSSITVASDNNYTFSSGEIGGAGGLIKSGTGTLTISSAGSYAGVTAISNGTVVVGSATALGSTAAGTVIASGATLDLNGTVNAAASEAITVSGSGVGGNGAIVNNGSDLVSQSFGSAPITLDGNTTLGGSGQFDFNGGSFAGNGYKLTKIGANTVVFTGNGNTDLGDISIESGGLTFAGNATLGRASSNLVIYPSTTLSFSAVNNSIALVKNIIATNGAILTSGGTTLLDTPIVFNTALEVGGAGNTIFSNTITGGAGSLSKSGAGTVTLYAANNFSGATIISNGVLSLGNVNALQNTSGINIGGASPATLTFPGDTTGVIIGVPVTVADSGINSTITFGRNTANAGTLTLSGGITGAGNVLFSTPTANGSNGGQTEFIELAAASTYAGNTTINTSSAGNQFANTIRAGVVNALPVTTLLRFAGNVGTGSGRASTYDLNGFNQTVSGLNNNNVPQRRNYLVTSPTAATLTISNTVDYAFGGANLISGTTSRARIQGAISLTKNGPAIFTLGGTLSGGAAAPGNTFTGDTKVLGGILVLGETTSIQDSTLDTLNSIAGTATDGLRTLVTSLTIGGLSGNKALASLFETTSGGYGGLTSLTLNPGLGFTPSYSGAIADGAAGMNLIKTGAGTQTLTGGTDWTGVTIVRAGKLAVTTIPTGTGALTVTNSATLAVTAGGSSWTPASLTVDTCTLEFNNVNTTTAPLAPAATVATPVTSVTINVTSLAGSPTVGLQYALITNVTATTGYSLGLQPSGFAGSLVVSADTLYYQVDTISDVWTGVDAANPTFWNIGISTNWVSNALFNSPVGSYLQNDAVLFDDTATTFTVAIQNTVTPNGVNFNTTANAYTITGSGTNIISGSGGLTKLGTNQVTLLGGEHAYSGATTISAGTLQLGDGTGGNDAALTNTSSVLNNGALVYNLGGSRIASYPITGNGTVTKNGAGTMTLLGTNTYLGVTTINGGTLEIGGSGSLNNGNYAANIANNGTLLYSSSAEQTLGGSISGTGAVTKSGVGVVTLSVGSSFSGQLTVENGTVSIAGAVNESSGGAFGDSSLPVILGSSGNTGTVRFTGTLGNYFNSKRFTMATGGSGAFQITNTSTTFHLSGVINGNGGLVKSGPGVLNLTATNTYAGDTTVSNGTLIIHVATIATNSTVTVASPGVLNLSFVATNRIGALVVDGTNVANGIYSSANLTPFLAGTGSLQVGVPGPSGPAMLTNSVSGGVLSLSWPAGEGWRLEHQTNTLSVGLNTNWVEAADSSVSSTNITIDPTTPAVFYRLVYP